MTINSRTVYEQLLLDCGTIFEDFYRIYTESLPRREQKPKAQIAAMVTRPDYWVLLARRNGVVIGFSILFIPSRESFGLVEYMAIDRPYRDMGAGSELFRHSVHAVVSNRGDIPILLEVDSDREASADQVMRRRRQLFYRRLGCLRIDRLSYLLPLPGEGSPPEMDLFVYVLDKSRIIRKSELEHWLRVLYQEVYNVSPKDARILRMTKCVEDPVRLV